MLEEQLAIVVRMAIASLTGLDDGGVPLILDDARRARAWRLSCCCSCQWHGCN